MKLAISNIAWPAEKLEDALGIMQKYGARGLEIAPSLAFYKEPNPFAPSDEAIERFLSLLSKYDICPVSMQSLLFGADDAFLFGSIDEQRNFKVGLKNATQLAKQVNIPNLVVGSPKNRVIPESMSVLDATACAKDIFYELGDYADRFGVTLAIEANPAEYGTNFLNTTQQVIDFVEQVDHPAITANFDIGALQMNDEVKNTGQLYESAASKISHIHISEPDLKPVPKDKAVFSEIALEIICKGYSKWFSIEMLVNENSGLAVVEKSLKDCSEILKRLGAK
ncbi:hypothetical protein GCM10009096_02530 [Parasphingorhabdus litoris]|uniref:Xylose isomerase-like TIM barrel domain-containing protein n=1 Tax=Parasphingorhabdus litoris TaxID=394733 RepID=A0ABP3JXL2_9SPHN|nr:sugar phosphate isomerase/epimerase [Parasphingorhabdus litoris]